jgi:hypothetical protein
MAVGEGKGMTKINATGTLLPSAAITDFSAEPTIVCSYERRRFCFIKNQESLNADHNRVRIIVTNA